MRIKNKKQFARSIITILLTIVSIVLIILFMENLKIEGLGSLFTVGAYKEAFEVTKTDITIINIWELGFVGATIYMAYAYLDYYSKMAELEAEEQEALQNI